MPGSLGDMESLPLTHRSLMDLYSLSGAFSGYASPCASLRTDTI